MDGTAVTVSERDPPLPQALIAYTVKTTDVKLGGKSTEIALMLFGPEMVAPLLADQK